MSGNIKYLDNHGKNMPFKIEDDCVLVKYNDIWNKIKKTLDKKFHSKPGYNKKTLKTFTAVVNTVF